MVCDDHCKGCYYLAGQVGRSHQETYCLYWERADKLRGCPAGAGCNKKITKKEYAMAFQSKWDKEAGRQMWLDGKSDKEIAAAYGVSTTAVRAVRTRVWEMDGKERVLTSSPEEPPQDDTTAMDGAEAVGADPSVAFGDSSSSEAEKVDPEEEDAKVLIHALELMTSHLKGMEAVMTAQVVTALWKWQDKEDLIEVRNCLDYLIGRCEK